MMKIPSIAKLSLVMTVILCACSPNVATTVPTIPPSTSTTAPTSTATLVPTKAVPIAYVGGPLPCFAEPQINYNIVSTVQITDQPIIQGIDPSGHFFAIEQKDGKGYCWIEASYVSVQGDFTDAAIIMPTPTPAPKILPAPTNFTAQARCLHHEPWVKFGEVILEWEDQAEETGYAIYRIYKDIPSLIVELGPDTIRFVDSLNSHIMPFHSKPSFLIYEIVTLTADGASEPAQAHVTLYCR